MSEFVAEFGNYTDMIKRMFSSVGADLEYQVFDSRQGEYPHDLDAWDFYITTGSKAGAYQDIPWIRQLISFVQRLDKQQKKLIGICFGHQIIAMARQGQVEKSLKGWGVGVAKNRVIAHPEWMKEPAGELNIIASHQDQITRLPYDTRVIASSDFCPCFVVQWGNHFLSIQGHPEWLPAYSRALMNHRRDILGNELTDAGLASLDIAPDNALFTRWILDFIAF
jgi:GMP synthase-like glutamine amidotransferase